MDQYNGVVQDALLPPTETVRVMHLQSKLLKQTCRVIIDFKPNLISGNPDCEKLKMTSYMVKWSVIA